MPRKRPRVRVMIRLAAFAMGVLAQTPATAEDAPSIPLMTTVSVNDARDLLTYAGADVDEIDYGADNFTITATLSPGRHVSFEGMGCKGLDQAMVCTEFKISSAWQLDTAARAEALAKQLSYNYTSVYAEGAGLELWRMDFTYGGISREHLRLTLGEFLQLRQRAENLIWPTAKGSALGQPDEK